MDGAGVGVERAVAAAVGAVVSVGAAGVGSGTVAVDVDVAGGAVGGTGVKAPPAANASAEAGGPDGVQPRVTPSSASREMERSV